MSLTKAINTFRDYVGTFCQPVDRRTPSQWAADVLYLPSGAQESKAGPIDWNYAPYLPEIVDCRTDPGVIDVYVAGPTRSGKTFILRVDFAYSTVVDPSPSLWIDSTVDKARGYSKKEIIPMVEANECLRRRKPKNRHNFTTTDMLFPGAAFTMYGANSDAQVSGDTVRIVRGNEIDKWRDATEKEASIIEQARHRTESYEGERFHIWSSTPTLEDGSIWQGFLRGDQRKYHVPCPHCKHMQPYVFTQIKWDAAAKKSDGTWNLDRVKASAYYECESCKKPWHEADRQLVGRSGQWIPTAQGLPGYRSYTITGPMVLLESGSFGSLAVDFLSSRTTGFLQDRQDFWNSRWGHPWVDTRSFLTIEKFAALERSYLRGTLPDNFTPDAIIVGADVQTWGLPWVVRAVNYAGESYCIDHGVSASWDDLQQVQTDYAHLARSFVIIDINYEGRSAEVKEAIFRRIDLGWMGAEGFEFAKQLVSVDTTDPFIGGKLQKQKLKIPILRISNYEFKCELEKKIAGEISGWYTYQLPLTADTRELEEQKEYYAQLLDERRVPRKNRRMGQPQWQWKDRGNNHAFDCEVYILALLWVLTKNTTFAQRAPSRRRRDLKIAR
jgi:phage terminase large subunit GpA-like protein